MKRNKPRPVNEWKQLARAQILAEGKVEESIGSWEDFIEEKRKESALDSDMDTFIKLPYT